MRVIHASELNRGRPMPSVSTIYRLLRRSDQSQERRAQRPPQRHRIPRIIARAPHQAWSWDISKLPTTTPGSTDPRPLQPLPGGLDDQPQGERRARAPPLSRGALRLRHRPGRTHRPPGPWRAHDRPQHSYRELLDAFGVRRSYSHPRVSNDNPYSESYFKTLKYTPGYPKRFEGIEHAREWMSGFIATYKNRPHEGLAFYTPADVFNARSSLSTPGDRPPWMPYYATHPERYPKGPPIAQRPPEQVTINPGDRVTTMAENVLNDPQACHYAYAPTNPSTTENAN